MSVSSEIGPNSAKQVFPGGVATLSTKEAARFLGISHRTMEDWRLKGRGPTFVMWGKSVRYRWTDLWDFLGGEGYRNTGEAGRA